MTPSQTDILLSAVGALREDMGRRFQDVKDDFQGVNDRLDKVDGRIGTIETTQAVAKALVAQAKEAADAVMADTEKHALSYRWRITIGVAACAGLGGLLLNLFNVFVIGK